MRGKLMELPLIILVKHRPEVRTQVYDVNCPDKPLAELPLHKTSFDRKCFQPRLSYYSKVNRTPFRIFFVYNIIFASLSTLGAPDTANALICNHLPLTSCSLQTTAYLTISIRRPV